MGLERLKECAELFDADVMRTEDIEETFENSFENAKEREDKLKWAQVQLHPSPCLVG